LRDISFTRRRYLKAALPEPLKVRCARWIPIGRFLCGDGTESKLSTKQENLLNFEKIIRNNICNFHLTLHENGYFCMP
jgi:hypothetical protein